MHSGDNSQLIEYPQVRIAFRRIKTMLVHEATYNDISHLNRDLKGLNDAIGTTYIPMGETVEELIQNFTKIQLSRRFNPGCGTPASLDMTFNENKLEINYVSTSCTEVFVTVGFDNHMQPENCSVVVGIPDDRAKPGRHHYESITRFMHQYDSYRWIEHEDGTRDMRIKKGSDRPIEHLPTPHWQLDEISNRVKPEDRDRLLAKYGFYPCNQLGFKKAWRHEDGRVIVIFRPSHQSTRHYDFLQESYLPECGMSFRELLLSLKSASKSPSSKIYEDYEEFEEFEEVEEFDYAE